MTRTRLAAACLAAALAAPCLLVLRRAASLPETPFVEDSFYSLAVARHLALGHGPSADGIHLTSGFQPLWSFVVAPVYWLLDGDRLASLRGVLLLEWACFVAATLGAMRIAASLAGGHASPYARAASATAGLMWCASGHLWRQSFNGLETGLYLAATAWFWNLWLATPRDARGSALRIGCAAGALVLVRVDAVLVVAALAGHELVAGAAPPARRVGRAATIAIVAAVVSSPWWIYNVVGFGTLMPSSGRATAAFGLADADNRGAMLDAVACGLAPDAWLFGQPRTVVTVARIAAAAAVLATALRRARRAPGPERPETPTTREFVRVQLAVLGIFVVWYLTRSSTFYFYHRYLAPTAVLGVPLVAAAVAPWLAGPGRLRAAVFVGAALAAAAAAVAYPVAAGRDEFRAPSPYLTGQVALVERHVPAGELVAASQSGTLGYFRDLVVNLDGKVNAEALDHAADIGSYLEEKRVRWICDNHAVSTWVTTSSGAGRWKLVDASGIFELRRRDDD